MFKRTVTRKGKQYTYFQQSVRKGKKVRSLHLGKVPPERVGLAYIERQIEQYPGDPFETKAREQKEAADKALQDATGGLAEEGK